MARAPSKSCPNLYRLIDGAEIWLIFEFLDADEFKRRDWIGAYRDGAEQSDGRQRLLDMLHTEKKTRLDPLEIEATRIVSVAERRGQYALDGLAQAKLGPADHAVFKAQKDDLARSLWTWVHQRLLFDAAVSALHHELYRRYAKHYQSFQAKPVQSATSDASLLDDMIADIEARLDRGSGCTIQRFDLPAAGDQPASEMYILYHPNPLTSAREVREDGERRTIYFRPPGEATIVYTPSTGVIEVRADTKIIRQQVAESFASKVLDEDLSSRPLDHRDYDLSRFFRGFALDCPEVDGFAVRMARVIKAEVSIGCLRNRLALATTIDEDLDDLIASHSGLETTFRRAIAVRFIDIAVRYVPAGETAEKTLDFTISDQNSCSLLSLPDERERILGHRLLRHWGILRELRTLDGSETRRTLPVLLELWDAGYAHVSGVWFRNRGIDPALLTATGFLEPVGWEETDLVDDEDVGLVGGQVIAHGARSHLRFSEGQVADGGSSARYRRFRVDQTWLIEHLRRAVTEALDKPYPEALSQDLFTLGSLSVDGADVPVYLARRLNTEQVLATTDVLLRSRGDRGLGLVLNAGQAAFRCIGANVLSGLSDHLTEDEGTFFLDAASMRMAFDFNRHLARGGQTVELVWAGDETGELFVPGQGSIQINGLNRLIVVDRLVKAHKRGAPRVKTEDLNRDLGGVAIRNIFGKALWERLEGRFIRSAGHGLWEIAA